MLVSSWNEEDWHKHASTNYKGLLDLMEVPKVTYYPTAHPASADRVGEYLLRDPGDNRDEIAVVKGLKQRLSA